MIKIYSIEEKPEVIRKKLEHGDDVFLKARDFYHNNKDMRHHKIVVCKNDEPVYCLGYVKNNPLNVDKHNPRVQMHLSNYWFYNENDTDLDYSYVDRYQLIIFEKLEEYSHHISEIVRRHNRNIKIAFTDKNAKFFYDDDVLIAENEEELFANHPDLKQFRTLRGISDIIWDVGSFFMDKIPTIGIMTSLYWLKREFSYGELNPDKTFYLIKQPVKENGLTALVSNVIGIKQMIRKKNPQLIPVVDLGVANDPNQFMGTSGEDPWSVYFKQLSDYSLEEVYNSKHVILDQNSNLNMNPYLTEFVFSNARAELKYGDDLQLNDKTREAVDRILNEIFPKEKKHILAVVARGSDYLAQKTANYVPHGISVEELLEKTIHTVKENSFDLVFLATEDKKHFDLFNNSELKDKLIYVNQERIDYQKQENNEKLLLEIFAQDNSDPYPRTIRYLAVLEGLIRCDALMANVTCGAVTYSLGRKDDFEFVDVAKIRDGVGK